MNVNELMTKNVITAKSNDTILDVAKMMKDHNIGCIPIVENGQKVLGVITDRDIVLNMAKYNFDPASTNVKEFASDVVYRIKPDADIEYALDLMKKQKIRRLTVLDGERLVGIISLGDIAVHSNMNVEVGDTLFEISQPTP